MAEQFQWPVPGWETVRKTGEDRFGTIWEIRRENGGTAETAAARYLRVPESDAEPERLRREGKSPETVAQMMSDRAWTLVNDYKLTGRLKDCKHVAVCRDVKCLRHREGPGWDVYVRTESVQPLPAYLDGHPDWSRADTIRLGRELAEALAACEDRKTVHGGIRPESVYAAADGRFLLGDFNVARTLEQTKGDSDDIFPAPEQIRGEAGDERSDQYSLGVLLCWLLNGRRLPGGELAVPPDCRPALKTIIGKACAWDPKERYPSAGDLLSALRDPELDSVPETVPERQDESGGAETEPAESGQGGSEPESGRQDGPGDGSRNGPAEQEDKNGSAQEKNGNASGQEDMRNNHADSGSQNLSEQDDGPEKAPEDGRKQESGPEQDHSSSARYGRLDPASEEKLDRVLGKKAAPNTAARRHIKNWLWLLPVLLAALAICWFEVHIWTPADGGGAEICRICRKTRCEISGHDWAEPVYTWKADNTEVQAIRVCRRDASHTETESAKTTVRILSEADGQNEGVSLYTARFQSRAFEEQTKTVTIPRIPEIHASDVSVGDYIPFGAYEQDNNAENGREPVEWKVLAKEDERILVISRYALDCRQYNARSETMTWEACSLRSWLNEEFLNSAFSAEEQKRILSAAVEADRNPNNGVSPGSSTEDRVFLLSITEAFRYFGASSARMCEPTAYAAAQGAGAERHSAGNSGQCSWWLRTPGVNAKRAAFVNSSGAVDFDGISVNNMIFAVRPALWIAVTP